MKKTIIKQIIEAEFVNPTVSKGYYEFGSTVLVLEKLLSSCIYSYSITRGDYNVK